MRRKKRISRLAAAIVGGLIILFLAYQVIIKGGQVAPFLFQILFNKNIELKKDESNVNVLILGIGGREHEGPNLTDTIIFASFNTTNKKITLVSIPRDMWISDLKGRINTAYSVGETKRRGGGIPLAKAAVKKITGQEIQYAIVINFSGFIKGVDLLGGLDIEVERAFDDYEYPVAGKENDLCGNKEEDLTQLATASSQLDAFPCRYTHVHFDKGLQQMDGQTALRFVRSRHARGPEGSDFARSQRQEKVIKAIRDKAFSLNILINPAKLLALYQTLDESIDTDIKTNEFDDFVKLSERFKDAKIQSVVLDYGDEREGRAGLLIHPPITAEFDYEWTLIPRRGNNNFEEIHDYVECQITKDKCAISVL